MNYDIITAIKIIAIIYSTLIYSYGGLLIAFYSDKYLMYLFNDKTDDDINKKTTFRHFTELSLILGLYAIFGYFARNILQEIPFPLEGYNGFSYMKVHEVASGGMIMWIILTFSLILTKKITILRNRLTSY